MPLTESQRSALEAKAKEQGLDASALIAEAEKIVGSAASGSTSKSVAVVKPAAEQPKLFMYLLPFVRVREVRQIWLQLEERIPGDEAIASDWAAQHAGASSTPSTPEPTE